MVRDESFVKRLASRVAEDIGERYGKPPNFVQLQTLIQRFVRSNPDVDPENVDWVSTWDPRLEYTEIVKAFKKRYPMYRWQSGEEEYGEERYLDELYNFLLTQAKELPEDLRLRLAKEISLEIGVQIPARPAVEARAEAVEVAVEKPRKPTITLQLLAKYPILPEMSKLISDIKLSEVPREVFDRVYQRVAEAVEHGEIKKITDNYYIELLSYPMTVMTLTAVGNEWLKRRWALAEAVKVEKMLDIEDDVVFDFIVSKMGFEKIDVNIDLEHPMLGGYSYRVPVTRYLKVIGDLLRDIRWKLVNQTVHRGYVYIRSRAEVSRIVREIMKNLLIQKFSRVSQKDLPKDIPYLWEKVEELKKLLAEKAPKHVTPTPVKGEMPPCIMQILAKIRGGEDVSHIENFTVASYMVNVGYGVDEIIDVFKDRSDFDERVARYQVEHIAGMRGSRVKYKPPSCSKMKSYGLCVEGGARCPRKIMNPLNYRAGVRGGEVGEYENEQVS